ncbi:hypothetical protein [Hydrocarboniclastica marina]|uniref:Uncharacterized protein n=1 Tax=Hydrocarboniclastica marina TaxID=2259620 RepID=A0A4P7XHD7_9ALTE|nr:hypothetical protein [Hydrocarboniclastica marina]QCF26449.1 hypothetical protein soil367_11160 [Hydrocarboniclastica marina]
MNDIEIYLKDPDPAAVQDWLERHFDRVQLSVSGNGKAHTGHAELKGRSVPVKLFLKAVGQYASLLFDGPDTPWDDDLSCARDAHSSLGVEVRCAADAWHEGEDMHDELWWSLSEKGERQIQWPQ